MTAIILYLASLAGAVGLFFIMRPHRQTIRIGGTILGAGAVAFMMVEVLKALSDDAPVPILEVVFGMGGIAGAVRMVTHPQPVFAAIWFVMVVVCSAGMFLLLGAEFMAFSLVIVYAGAILITYLFVLMLAQEATASNGEALYDRLPREPIAAIVVGFVLLASIGDALLVADGGVNGKVPDRIEAATRERWEVLDGLPKQLEETALAMARTKANDSGEPSPAAVKVVRRDDGHAITLDGDQASIDVIIDGQSSRMTLTPEAVPSNTQLVGWALVAVFPVSLEVAGVILLMAMFGAVVLARRQIDLGEDERRVAAGLGPLLEEDESDLAGGGS